VQLILGYLYKQKITVVKNADFEPHRENQLVYAKPLQIYKGVDNQYQFLIKNSDQKPVSLVDSTVLFNLIDSGNQELVFSRYLDIVYNDRGVASTILEATMLDDVVAGPYNYSILVVNPEGLQQIAYADDNYNAQGVAYVNDKTYPRFVPSIQPKLGPFYNNNPNTSGYSDANQVFTDVVLVNDRTKSRAVTQSVQYHGDSFSGTIEVQASLEPVPTALPQAWFTVHSEQVNGLSGTDYFNFSGKFSQVRFHITTASGSLTNLLYRP
jgi:hypothetical protein